MTLYRVRNVGFDLAERVVDSFDHEDAAADACELLDSEGSFAGEEVPRELEFDVTDDMTCETKRVVVTHDYSITWYGTEKRGGS